MRGGGGTVVDECTDSIAPVSVQPEPGAYPYRALMIGADAGDARLRKAVLDSYLLAVPAVCGYRA